VGDLAVSAAEATVMGDTYTKEVGSEICRLISCGKSLVQACAINGGTPSRDTFYSWLHKHAELREMYDLANTLGLEAMADDVIAVADEVKVVDSMEAINRARLRVDARKWIMAKRNPKKWGDNISLGAEDGKGGGFKITISSVLNEEQA
jgi:hypothetical protein